MKYALVTVLVPVSEGTLVPAEVVDGLPTESRFTSHVVDQDDEGGDYLQILRAACRQAGLDHAHSIAERGWPVAMPDDIAAHVPPAGLVKEIIAQFEAQQLELYNKVVGAMARTNCPEAS